MWSGPVPGGERPVLTLYEGFYSCGQSCLPLSLLFISLSLSLLLRCSGLHFGSQGSFYHFLFIFYLFEKLTKMALISRIYTLISSMSPFILWLLTTYPFDLGGSVSLDSCWVVRCWSSVWGLDPSRSCNKGLSNQDFSSFCLFLPLYLPYHIENVVFAFCHIFLFPHWRVIIKNMVYDQS